MPLEDRRKQMHHGGMTGLDQAELLDELYHVGNEDYLFGAVVDCDTLKVYSAPTTHSDVVYTLGEGDEVMIDPSFEHQRYFAVATEAGREGYCVKDFIAL